jgi:hypothetical protein
MSRTKNESEIQVPPALPPSVLLGFAPKKWLLTPRGKIAKRKHFRILEKLGLLQRQSGSRNFVSPRNYWRFAAWFVDFLNAPDISTINTFREEVEVLVSTVTGPIVRNPTDEELLTIQHECREAVNWFLERKNQKLEGVVPLMLNPIEGEEILQWVDNKAVRTFLPGDFRGKFLTRLFTLLASNIGYFGRCEICHKIFARRGRAIYCGRPCSVRARPIDQRRSYQRNYMKKIRDKQFLSRLKSKSPELWKEVVERRKTIKEARRDLRLIS